MITRALAALGLLVATIQPGFADDGASLVGIWKLVGWENEFQDTGERRAMYGKNPKGYIILTREGRMMAVLEGEGRKVPQNDAERLAAFRTIVAYTGIYRVEGDKWITKVDASWNPAWNGTEQERTFKLEGDRLSVVAMWQPNANQGGRIARGILTWVREK